MNFKNKSIFALLVIFILAMSVATIYAENASVGSLSFEVPSTLTIVEQNDTAITFKDSSGDRIMINEVFDSGSVGNAYLESQGYSYQSSFDVNRTTYNAQGGSQGAYSYNLLKYTGSNGDAYLYVFEVNGQEHCIIAYTSGNNSPTTMMGGVDGADDLLDAIMA